MKKFGIKKTWGNIILLFIIGVVIGAVIGLRQPMSQKSVIACQSGEPTCSVPQE